MAPASQYILLVIAGFVPSLIWLFYYLRKDCHPEPKELLTKVFLMGIILSPVAVILQLTFVQVVQQFFPTAQAHGVTFFIWAAFVEEVIKFYAVKNVVFNSREFDEPVDAMIYMVTAALGFAAMENILVLYRVLPDGTSAAMNIWILRFVGATILHALSSALTGYFVALAWFYRHHHQKLIWAGLALSTLFHFSFNLFLSSSLNQFSSLVATTVLLLILGFLVSILFGRLKERDNNKSAALV